MAPRSKINEGMLVSVDIGNGYVKARTGELRSAYPSVIAQISGMMRGFEFSLNGTAKRMIGYRGHKYAVGESVYFDGQTPIQIADRSRIRTEYYRVLMASALAEVLPYSCDVRVVVSLPPAAYWDRDKQKAALSGVYEVERVLQDHGPVSLEYQVDASNMRVIPEGLGTVCAMALDDHGRAQKDFYLAESSVGIVDVGTFTTDLIQMDHLRIVRNGCATMEHALHDIHERLLSFVSSCGVSLEAYRADEVLHQQFFLRSGDRVYLNDELGLWTSELANAIAALIRSTWHGGDAVEYIVITGGGAPFVERLLHSEFPHVKLIDGVQPFFANCEGGYRYGMLRQRAEG